MSSVSASLVLYNTDSKEFSKTIDSFLSCDQSIELVIADNSPDNKLLDVIKCIYNKYLKTGRIQYFHLSQNHGYGKAHNFAYKARKKASNYHIILNPDVVFDGKIIGTMIEYLDENNDVGQLMPKVYNADTSIQYLCKLLPTPMDLLVRRFIPLRAVQEKMASKYELRSFSYNEIINVPNLSGCFMFLRCEAFEKAGMFDERFFIYAEDMDLTRRIHSKYKTQFFPIVSIFHMHKRESYKNLKMLLIHTTSTIKYFNKWGWFFDAERKKYNTDTMLFINSI